VLKELLEHHHKVQREIQEPKVDKELKEPKVDKVHKVVRE
jgi:hypothetical protein